MFDLPNIKGMEVVLHYFFAQLDPARATTEFRDCWPVYDKKQEQAFRKKCVQWFTAIARDCPQSGLPRQGASLLLSPEGVVNGCGHGLLVSLFVLGKKFYRLLLNFSYYCLRSVFMNSFKRIGN